MARGKVGEKGMKNERRMKDEGEGGSMNREAEGGCSPTVSEASLPSFRRRPQESRRAGEQEVGKKQPVCCLRPQSIYQCKGFVCGRKSINATNND